MERMGHCSRCGKCCNVNNFPPGTTTIGQVREDGSCVHLNKNDCLRHFTVRGKPTICQLFPMGPSDIASIPECIYSFVDDDDDSRIVEQASLILQAQVEG